MAVEYLRVVFSGLPVVMAYNLMAGILRSLGDGKSPLYAMIVKNPLNLQKYTSAAVDESSITVSDYRRYSQELFSARVKLTQNIIRKDGTLKVYKLDKTYFFTKNSSGKSPSRCG